MTGMNTGTGLKTFAELYSTGYQPTGGLVSVPQNFSSPTAPAPNLAQDGQNSLEKSPKSDTITIAGKTIKKKTVIKAGLGALATAAVIGIGIFAFRGRGKTPPVQPPVVPPTPPTPPVPPVDGAPVDVQDIGKLADELQTAATGMLQRAQETIEMAQKKIDAVTELFKNGGKDASGKVVATIEDDIDSKVGGKVMRELVGDNVIRESFFGNDGFCSITDHLENSIISKGKDGYIMFQNPTKLLHYNPTAGKGFIRYEEGSGISAPPIKELEFINGRIAKYTENATAAEEGSLIEKIIHFSEEGPDQIVTIEAKSDEDAPSAIHKFFEKLEDGTWGEIQF